MTNHGDDCYFYFYSTCTKGDCCPFRHCEAAMGSETVCNLWQENRCFRKICKFRHMEIKKKRSEIPCYWENQPAGCQKPHCAFHHEKPRFIDGIYVPPSKVPILRKEGEEEAVLIDPPPPAPAPIANPANPQLRGVFKTETLENVPSPTHPPVVINTVDDEDEDEDDQFSEEGDDHKSGSDGTRIVSPRKLISNNQDDSLNFGIKTLEEIRLRKALKANLKKSGQLSVQTSSNNGTNVEKENIRASLTSVLLTAKEDSQLLPENPPKCQIGDRLGKRKFFTGDELISASRAQKSIRNRLGLPVEPACSETDSCTDVKLSGEIRIKTLEEIKQEKASRSQEQPRSGSICTTAKAPGPLKRPGKALASPNRKYSEVLHAKKKLEEKTTSDSETALSEKKDTLPKDMGSQGAASVKIEEVRVKTLDEIRREKAARMQAKVQDTQTEKQPSTGKGFTKRRILRINKAMAPDAVKVNEQKTHESMEQSTGPVDTKMTATNGKTHSSGESVSVKSFEEIMREKKLRKQQMEQVDSSLQSQHSSVLAQEQAIQKGKSLITARPRGSSVQLSPESSTQAKALLRGGQQKIALKQKDSVPVPPAEQNIFVSTSLEKRGDPPSTSPINSVPSLRKRPSPVSLPVPDLVPVEAQEVVLKKSPGRLPEPKVRPKLNVKPSIMKLATQVQLIQKRREPESPRSAVAAVKPLNSTAVEIQPREPTCNHPAISASTGTLDTSVQGSSRVLTSLVMEYSTQGPSDLALGLEESSRLQTQAVSITDQRGTTYEPAVSPAKETSKSTFAVSKTPSHGKTRRLSTVSARASSAAVDDFDELMNEFTDDRLEDEMELDPGKGEDDLLLELSEMIDS